MGVPRSPIMHKTCSMRFRRSTAGRRRSASCRRKSPWIGRSEGLLIRFEVAKDAPEGENIVEVFTTRPDTLFGASFLGLAPDHQLSKAIATRDAKAASFIAECQHHGTSAAEIETKKREYQTGLARETSGHRRRRASRLHRQFHPHRVRRRRHLRLPGAPTPARPRTCRTPMVHPVTARRAAA